MLFIIGESPVLTWFRPWTFTVRLDVFHFMRRFTNGLTTEHHPLYGTFCSKLSSCIFKWDKANIEKLQQAKRAELVKKHQGHNPTHGQVLASITTSELAAAGKREGLRRLAPSSNNCWTPCGTSQTPQGYRSSTRRACLVCGRCSRSTCPASKIQLVYSCTSTPDQSWRRGIKHLTS